MLSHELTHSSANSQWVITFIHIPQTHLTCLSPLSSLLSSYGTSLPRFAPNPHLHPDIAPITKQGDWVNYLYRCQYRHKPSPGSALLCAALFYTWASEDSCSIVLPLISYCWYQLEPSQVTDKSCLGRCPGPGGSHNTGVSSICRLTGLQQEV